ncbi:ROK family transcriptional regulator [Jatrophihabitans sp. YIM 134969]
MTQQVLPAPRRVQPTSGALRAANRARVVGVLRGAGWATRAELVEHTGLSRATISSLLHELAVRGLIAERPPAAAGTPGRPASQVALDKSAGTAIAVDIGVRHVAVAVGDLSHSVLAERWTTVPRDHTADRGIDLVLAKIEQAVAEADVDADALVGAAISIAAPVTAGGGRLAVPDVLPGWNGSVLAERVADRWDIPVVTENDANLGALGEALREPVSGDGDVLYVKVASRIGLGVARGSRILRGRSGYTGEFGHVTVHDRAERCWCGRRGCLELYAGGDGMLRRIGSRGGATTIAELVERAHESDRVRRVVEDGASVLAQALADLVLVLDPARVVLGGELVALGSLLEDPVRAALTTLPFGPPVDLTVSPLGERASLVGALSLVLTETTQFADRSQGRGPTTAPPRPPTLPLVSLPTDPGVRL